MILPIGHENWNTRRLPWVNILVAAGCIAAWLWTLGEHLQMVAREPAYYREAAEEYWKARPYLEPHFELAFQMMLEERSKAVIEDTHRDAVSRGRSEIDPVYFQAAIDEAREEWELWLVSKRLRAQVDPPDSGETILAEQAELDRLTANGFTLDPSMIPPEGEPPAMRYGLVPSRDLDHGLVTYMFMHGSWGHLLGNLFLLFLVGPALEDRWGRPLYSLFYAAAGVAAGGFYMAMSMDSGIPMVGASGAVAGALGAFLVLFWSTRIKFLYFFLFLPPIWGTFSVPSWVVLPLWFGNEMGSAALSEYLGIETAVAYWAHVGGFLSGSLFAMLVKGLRLEERFIEGSISRRLDRARWKETLPHGRKLLAENNYQEAYFLFEQQLETAGDQPDFILGYWEAAVAFYKREQALPKVEAAIRAKHEAKDTLGAARLWQRAVEIDAGVPLEPRLLTAMAEACIKSRKQETELAQLALRYATSRVHESESAGSVLRAASLAAKLDPSIERAGLESALALGDFADTKRERISARVRELDAKGVRACTDPLSGHSDEKTRKGGDPVEIALDSAGLDDPRFSTIKLREAKLIGLDDAGLRLEIAGGKTGRLGYDRCQAIAVAVVPGLGERPVLLIDLLLNWQDISAEQLDAIRLRSDQFDPRALVGEKVDAQAALTQLIATIHARAGADALPSAEALQGKPFPRFTSADAYTREVLDVAG